MLQSASRGEGVGGVGGVPGWGGLLLGGSGLGGCVCSRGGAQSVGAAPRGVPGPGGIPACTEADTPPPPVDRHTLVKTLPWPNFVAAGKYATFHADGTRYTMKLKLRWVWIWLNIMHVLVKINIQYHCHSQSFSSIWLTGYSFLIIIFSSRYKRIVTGYDSA